MLDQGGNIGSGKVFVFAHADDKRTPLADGNQAIWILAIQDQKAISTRHTRLVYAHGLQGAVAEFVSDQLRNHFGVGFALEHHPVVFEVFAQDGEIFNNAVVHDGKAAVIAEMRVGVNLTGLAVRGPAGVGQADVPAFGFRHVRIKVGDPSHILVGDVIPLDQDAEAGGVVTAVFQ